jgi:hypothetical protein
MDKKIVVCTYCGKSNPETFDHVPPACIFPDPKPKNLITVPCCINCNRDASKDDEYFKMMIALRGDVVTKPSGQILVQSVFRALSNPKKRRMLYALRRHMRPVTVNSPSGLYLGKGALYDVSLQRLDKVAVRIVKGLFFKEEGHLLPSSYDVKAFEESGLIDINSDVRRSIESIVIHLYSTPPRVIQPGIFQFWYYAVPEDINTSVWLLRFYESVNFICLTAPNIDSEAAA